MVYLRSEYDIWLGYTLNVHRNYTEINNELKDITILNRNSITLFNVQFNFKIRN